MMESWGYQALFLLVSVVEHVEGGVILAHASRHGAIDWLSQALKMDEP